MEIDKPKDYKPWQFKPGHEQLNKPETSGRIPKAFKSFTKEFLDSRRDVIFDRLWQITVGYKGVKASESLAAMNLLFQYGYGKPMEHVINENYNREFKEYSAKQLADRAAELLKELSGPDARRTD